MHVSLQVNLPPL